MMAPDYRSPPRRKLESGFSGIEDTGFRRNDVKQERR